MLRHDNRQVRRGPPRGLLGRERRAPPGAGRKRLVRHARAAEQPEVDASFTDFTLPKFQCDDSLVRVQKKGELLLTTSNDWPYSYLGHQDRRVHRHRRGYHCNGCADAEVGQDHRQAPCHSTG